MIPVRKTIDSPHHRTVRKYGRLHSANANAIRSTATVAAVAVILFTTLQTGAAQSDGSDSYALDAIFAEQHVKSTVLDVHRRAMQLSVEDRYAFLLDWILPNANHDKLLIQMAFGQTNPAPVNEQRRKESNKANNDQRRMTGGDIISPVFDLLDAAQELGRLDRVYERVANWDTSDRDEASQQQAAMLALIELARNREAAASQRLDQFLKLTTSGEAGLKEPTQPELLVFHRGIDSRSTREVTADGLRRYQPWMRSEYHRTPAARHVAAMLGRLRAFELQLNDSSAIAVTTTSPMKQWFSVTRATAATRGQGCPVPRWDYRPGHIENVTSHDDDYLYFNTPLRGNFEVECDVSGFGWRDSQLMVAGEWVAPVYTHAAFDVGNFSREFPRVNFSPPLTKTKEWIHYRTVVRDQSVSTYFNGRLVREEIVPHDHDPWVAIRSSPRHNGAVRNLRISGNPSVPDELAISRESGFSGWLPYYDETVSGRSQWQHIDSGYEGGEIDHPRDLHNAPGGSPFLNRDDHASPDSDSTGTNSPDVSSIVGQRESLLRYHRPIVEDGSIEYDFVYVSGQAIVHPALDRLAFLLHPDGVRIHWITDGAFDRTNVSRSNTIIEVEHRRGPQPLPLQTGGWNHLKLTIVGDTALLTLNDVLIYERPIDETNQRTFGLFHFADQSHARVRNVVWKGNWPRKLPPLTEQELAADGVGFLDRDLDKLPAVFEHDFVKAGLPLEQFRILKGDPKAHVRHVEDGVLTTRPGTGGYRNATLAPALTVVGDFDIIASYRNFESSAAEGGNGTAMLQAILDNATADKCSVTRRHIHRMNNIHENVSQCVTVVHPVNGERRDYFGVVPMEESSGRLRLSRRGDQMYFLTAEGDSPHFQLRGQRQVATDPVQAEGLRLLTQIYQKGGEVSATWNHLIVRAEKLTGRAVEDFDSQLVKLNKERDQLKSRFTFDFSQKAPPEPLFRPWADQRQWDKSDGGLLIVAPGTDNWTSAGFSVMKPVTGDFDISVEFDVLKFDIPKAGQRCSVYLQIELPDKDNTQLSLIFTNNDTGATEVISQVREPRGPDKYHYRSTGEIDLTGVTTLRAARRGERMTFLAATRDSKQERIVGYLDRPAVSIPASFIRFYVHTGGADRESRVLWKSIDIRDQSTTNKAPARPSLNAQNILDPTIKLLRKQLN